MKCDKDKKLDEIFSDALKTEFTGKADDKVFKNVSEYFETAKNNRKTAKLSVFMSSFYKVAAVFALFIAVTFYSLGYLKDSSYKSDVKPSLPELYSRASWNIGTSIVQDSLRFVQASVLEIR